MRRPTGSKCPLNRRLSCAGRSAGQARSRASSMKSNAALLIRCLDQKQVTLVQVGPGSAVHREEALHRTRDTIAIVGLEQ